MKKRLLVSSALMLVLTSVAATSSTFAWFSVNRKGTVTSPEMTATAKDGGLDIASTPNGVTNLYDVSSKDGKTFYKPVLGPASTADAPSFVSCPVVYNGTETLNSNLNYFMELRISFTSSSTLGVYLSKDTTISIKEGSDVNKGNAALNSLRIAFLPANASYQVTIGNPLLVYAPASETGIKYVSSDTVTDGKLDEAIYSDTELGDGDNGYVQNGLITKGDITTNNVANKYYMGQVTNNTPLYIVARMWLEGTDKDCTNAAIGGIVSALLSFYGVE